MPHNSCTLTMELVERSIGVQQALQVGLSQSGQLQEAVDQQVQHLQGGRTPEREGSQGEE